MSLFRKIFGLKDTPEDHIKSEERGKYMPEIKLPIDEKFTINFKANGGKFLYCENMEEIHKTLKKISKIETFLIDGSRQSSNFVGCGCGKQKNCKQNNEQW